MQEANEKIRLDIWLWAARFFKTRALAKQAIESGKIEIAGQRCKAGRPVRVDDQMRVTRGTEIFEVRVVDVSDKRGPAKQAMTLYSESEESRQAREQLRATLGAQRAGYQPPESKPDKRARRLIRALGDIDAM